MVTNKKQTNEVWIRNLVQFYFQLLVHFLKVKIVKKKNKALSSIFKLVSLYLVVKGLGLKSEEPRFDPSQ